MAGGSRDLILIHVDGTTFVHSHPDETDPNNGKIGQITFNARFPMPGAYRGRLKLQRGGRFETATLTVAASGGVPVFGAQR